MITSDFVRLRQRRAFLKRRAEILSRRTYGKPFHRLRADEWRVVTRAASWPECDWAEHDSVDLARAPKPKAIQSQQQAGFLHELISLATSVLGQAACR